MKKFLKNILSIFTSILFIYIFIFFSIIFLLLNRNFYYLHIKPLKIIEKSGYTLEDIKNNYNAILDYFLPFSKNEFNLPTIPYSIEGKIHFQDVKNIFNIVFILGIITIILLILLFYYYYKKRDSIFLKKASKNCIFITIMISLIGYYNFDKSFILFHKLFFNNNYWIFDEKKDPIIKILPQEFFRNCSIVIFIFIILGSISLYIIYTLINKSKKL